MSSIEWLEQNFPNISANIGLGIALEIAAKFQQAKEMHRKEIEDATKGLYTEKQVEDAYDRGVLHGKAIADQNKCPF